MIEIQWIRVVDEEQWLEVYIYVAIFDENIS